MAKLTARGATVLISMVKENFITNSDLISWERVTIALRSDGQLLKKRDIRFLPDTLNPSGNRHSYGWKVQPHRHDRTPAGIRIAYGGLGYKEVSK